MIRRLRRFLLVAFLLGFQQAALLHATVHASEVATRHDTVVQSPADLCAECALFAGGAAAPVASAASMAMPAPSLPAIAPFHGLDGAAFRAAYRSRAPPFAS